MVATPLSSVSRLLLGVTTPEREPEHAVLAFVAAVRDAHEPGSSVLANITASTGLPRERLNRDASHFIHSNAQILQHRVDRLIKERPETRMLIARSLASNIRAFQEEDQQILLASQQLAEALRAAIPKMTLSPSEEKGLTEALIRFERTGSLASREINTALLLANNALVESGAAGPAEIARSLLLPEFDGTHLVKK